MKDVLEGLPPEFVVRLMRQVRDRELTPEEAFERLREAEGTAARSGPQEARRAPEG